MNFLKTNLRIALMLFAGVAFFASCEDTEVKPEERQAQVEQEQELLIAMETSNAASPDFDSRPPIEIDPCCGDGGGGGGTVSPTKGNPHPSYSSSSACGFTTYKNYYIMNGYIYKDSDGQVGLRGYYGMPGLGAKWFKVGSRVYQVYPNGRIAESASCS